MKRKILVLMTILVPSTSYAESLEKIIQSAINVKGKPCAQVTVAKPLGVTDAGTPIIAVACSGGEQYAMRINDDDTVSLISSCSVFEVTTGQKCF